MKAAVSSHDIFSVSPLMEVCNLRTWFPVKRGLFSRHLGWIKAVDGVSLRIMAGETYGLVGESGCGKSTLSRTLLFLEKPLSGKILFMGRDTAGLKGKKLRRFRKHIQAVFQDPLTSLNPRMNICEILTEGLVRFGMLEGAKEDHARRLMAEVGLDPNAIYRFPHEFSGGQRQRINIARAISLRPDIVICDEAVSALDVSVQAQVLNLLFDLQERYGLSYFFISHDLSVVSCIADRIGVMYLGRLVEEGPAPDIISDPMHPYTKMLLAALPQPGRGIKKDIPVQGEAPSAMAPPPGCRFHPRCPSAMQVCCQDEPEPVAVDGRIIECHLYRHGG